MRMKLHVIASFNKLQTNLLWTAKSIWLEADVRYQVLMKFFGSENQLQ